MLTSLMNVSVGQTLAVTLICLKLYPMELPLIHINNYTMKESVYPTSLKPVPFTTSLKWLPQIWPGNPSLNLVCSCKIFINPFNSRRTPTWIYGGTKEHPRFSFTVAAGSTSEFSYTGTIDARDIFEAQKHVDQLFTNKQLFK
jgi:hypothetical protein